MEEDQKKIWELLRCAVCYLWPLDPVRVTCSAINSHRDIVCEPCVLKQGATADGAYRNKCGLCKHPLPPAPRPIDTFKEELRSMLSVSCPYHMMDQETGANNGCSVTRSLPTMKAHMEKCRYGRSPCIYAQQGCNSMIRNSEMAAHIPICGRRPLDCKFRFNSCDWLDKPAEEVEVHQHGCPWDSVLGMSAPGRLGIPIMSCRSRLSNRACRFRKIIVLEFSFTIAVTGYEFQRISEYLETETFRLMQYNDNMVMRSATEMECLEAMWKASESSGVPLKGDSPNHAARRDEAVMENLAVDDLLSMSLDEEEMDQLDQQPASASNTPTIVTIEPMDLVQNELQRIPANSEQVGEEPPPEEQDGTAEIAGEEDPPAEPMENAEPIEPAEDNDQQVNATNDVAEGPLERTAPAGPAETTEQEEINRDQNRPASEPAGTSGEAAGPAEPAEPAEPAGPAEPAEQDEINRDQDGPAAEHAESPIEQIQTQQQMMEFMREQGSQYNTVSMADLYAANYARLIGNPAGQEEWRQNELDRLAANKDCMRQNLVDCTICAETSSPIFPTGRKGRHLHISTRLRQLEESNCPRCYSCNEDSHPIRPEFRRKLILTSSSLSSCLTEGRPSFPTYGGLQRHTDVTAIHGAKIEDLCHAAWIELKNSNEPTDICLYGGINDVLSIQAYRREDGTYEADRDGMKRIFRALATLTEFLVNAGLKHTLRCCLISRPPIIFHQGPAKRRVWKEVCMALRATNIVWEKKWGVPQSKQLNFQEFGIVKKRGQYEQFNEYLYKAYREMEPDRKLHLTGPYKLGFALKIVRVLGVKTIPENFSVDATNGN